MASRVPEININQPGNTMLKQLAGTVLRGVISDVFSEARREKVSESATLLQGWKSAAEQVVKFDNVQNINDAILDFSNQLPDHKEGSPEYNTLIGVIDKMEAHKTNVEDQFFKEQKKGGLLGTIEEYKERTKNLNEYDLVGINAAIKDLESDINIISSDEDYNTNSVSIKTVKTLDGILVSLQNSAKIAKINNEFGESLIKYDLDSENLKDDKEQYRTEATKMLGELNDALIKNSIYISEKNWKKLNSEVEEHNVWLQGFSALDQISEWKEQDWKSEGAKIELMVAERKLPAAMRDGRMTEILEALGSLDRAYTEEIKYNKQFEADQLRDAKAFSKDTLQKISPSVNKADSMLGGKGGSREVAVERLPDQLVQQKGSPNALVSTPSSLFDDFKMETAQNAQTYKKDIGKELSKFVAAGSLNSFTEKERKQIVSILGEGLSSINVSSQNYDKLYEILSKADTEYGLNWINNMGRDQYNDREQYTNELYKEYLNIYKTIYDSDQRAKQGLFRTLYGEDTIHTSSVGSGFTEYESEIDNFNKKLPELLSDSIKTDSTSYRR